MGAFVSTFFAILVLSKSKGLAGTTALLLFIGPLGGPLSEPLAYTNYSVARMVGWGTMLGALILLHPLRPNAITAVISSCTLAFWLLYGLALTYFGV